MYNLFTFFPFYELLTFLTYPLVTHNGSSNAKQGGKIYLGILLLTSICFLLLAICITYSFAGTLDFSKDGIDITTVAKLHDNCKMFEMDRLEGVVA